MLQAAKIEYYKHSTPATSCSCSPRISVQCPTVVPVDGNMYQKSRSLRRRCPVHTYRMDHRTADEHSERSVSPTKAIAGCWTAAAGPHHGHPARAGARGVDAVLHTYTHQHTARCIWRFCGAPAALQTATNGSIASASRVTSRQRFSQ